MKVQSYYSSKAGNSYKVAAVIAKDQSCKVDQIPPAYQPEKEAVVFISFETGKPETAVLNFIKTLTAEKTKSIAFAVVGPDTKGLDEMKAAVTDSKIKIHENVFECKVASGLFKKGKVTDDQLREALTWSQSIVESMHA